MAALVEPNLGLHHSWALDEDLWNDGMDANLKMIGAVVQLAVINLTTSAQPGSPTEGARYIIPTSHTWPLPAAANAIAVYANGAWRYYTPQAGWRVDNLADGLEYRFTGSAWSAASAAIAAGSVTNSHIAAGAAIALSKLAALTVSRALVSDGSGVISASATTAAQIAALNALTNTGIVYQSSGALANSTNATLDSSGVMKAVNYRMQSAPDSNGFILQNSSALIRWIIRGSGTETGANAGYNLEFNARADDQSGISSPIFLIRATGELAVGSGGLTAQFSVLTASASRVVAKIRAAASQTANIREEQDSSANILRGTNAAGKLLIDGTLTAAGTTGAQTINKPAGRVNFAAGATSLVVTNSLSNANCQIKATVQTNDSTMKSVVGVAASGSFTLHPNAAPTAETAVFFEVVEIV